MLLDLAMNTFELADYISQTLGNVENMSKLGRRDGCKTAVEGNQYFWSITSPQLFGDLEARQKKSQLITDEAINVTGWFLEHGPDHSMFGSLAACHLQGRYSWSPSVQEGETPCLLFASHTNRSHAVWCADSLLVSE